jgi:hypothetical protein
MTQTQRSNIYIYLERWLYQTTTHDACLSLYEKMALNMDIYTRV